VQSSACATERRVFIADISGAFDWPFFLFAVTIAQKTGSHILIDPFQCDPVINVKPIKISKSRTTSPSRIQDLSVGAIRYSFLQLRACEKLDVNFILWTGIPSGRFALEYLLMSSSMQKKTRSSKSTASECAAHSTEAAAAADAGLETITLSQTGLPS
jgi:hypothetical protein